MANEVLDFLTDEALKIMERTFSDEAIKENFEIQLKITHVIPIRHRVLGGLYQSVNIKFGNFLEILMKKIIENDERYTVVKKITTEMPVDDSSFSKKNKLKDFPLTNTVEGGKSTMFIISKRNQKLIDDYIIECTKADADKTKIKTNFDALIKNLTDNIIEEKKNPYVYDYLTFKNDVDLLFFKNKDNNYFYVELKKEDNHDSDKTKAMYEKVIKTFACLMYQAYSNEDETLTINSLTPILMFFGDINNPSNILPEEAVFSGKDFFDKYLTINFSSINKDMCRVSNSERITEFLDNKIMEILTYPNEKLLELLNNIIESEIKTDATVKTFEKEIEILSDTIEKIIKFKNTLKKKEGTALFKQIEKISNMSLNKEDIQKDLDISITNKDLQANILVLESVLTDKKDALIEEKQQYVNELKTKLEDMYNKNIIEEIAN